MSQVIPFAEWEGVSEGYRFVEVCVTDAQVPQRWVVVDSEQRRQSDLKQLAQPVEREQKRQQQQLTKRCC